MASVASGGPVDHFNDLFIIRKGSQMNATNGETVDIDFGALFSDNDDKAAPSTPLEKAVESAIEISGPDAVERFQFRSLLTPKQLESMRAGAPKLANRMVTDLNTIVTFGESAMVRINTASTQLLEAQRDIRIPEADKIVNELLRELDGFEKQFRISAITEAAEKVRGFFRRKKYTFKTMVREAKPLIDRLDMAEVKILEMEMKLGENVTRGQVLHKMSLEHMDSVVGVLATLEEVIDIIGAQAHEADNLLNEAQTDGRKAVEWQGETIPVEQIQEIHANLVMALPEIEKTWHDWRQQFFMGFANAPATRNLVITQFALRRRLAAFRTMGIPQARQSLVMWQQVVLAKEGAQMADAVQAGVNKLIQQSYAATAESTAHIANAAQAPIVTEETVWSIVDSIREQCRAIVNADKAGRLLRERNLTALQSGEVTIKDEFLAAKNQLISNALNPSEGAGGATQGSDDNSLIDSLV